MLKSYENEMQGVAARVAEAERLARQIIGEIIGREEKYTEVFRVYLEQQLNGYSDGGVSWKLWTYTTDKQSGQETQVGADIVFAVDISIDDIHRSKSFLVQAKVNKNLRYGLSVDSAAKLREQCTVMTRHTSESYVFAYGSQSTKVVKATSVLMGAPLSNLPAKGVSEFFGDVMMCWAGDQNLVAHTHRDLEKLVRQMESKSGVLLKGTKRSR